MGGVARVATEAARRWARLGHEVVVLAPRHPGHAEEERTDGGPTVLRVIPRGRLPRTVADPLVTRRRARRFGHGSFDVLVGHTCTTAWGCSRRGSGAPLVDVFHADAAAEARHLRSVETSIRRRLTALALERLLGRLERVTPCGRRPRSSCSRSSAAGVRVLAPRPGGGPPTVQSSLPAAWTPTSSRRTGATRARRARLGGAPLDPTTRLV